MIDRRQALGAVRGLRRDARRWRQPGDEPHDGLCVFLRGAQGRRHQARRLRRQADPGREHRLAVRLHPAICRAAGFVEALPRARPDDRRRSVERFRRTGAGRRHRNRAHRAWQATASAFRWPPRPTCAATSQHPFYKWAAAEKPLELPRWNFHKYLIGRDGHVAGELLHPGRADRSRASSRRSSKELSRAMK